MQAATLHVATGGAAEAGASLSLLHKVWRRLAAGGSGVTLLGREVRAVWRGRGRALSSRLTAFEAVVEATSCAVRAAAVRAAAEAAVAAVAAVRGAALRHVSCVMSAQPWALGEAF